MKKIFAFTVAAFLCLSAAFFSVGAEDMAKMQVSETIGDVDESTPETIPEEESETVPRNETAAEETEKESTAFLGLYERGRRWAAKNPVWFTNIMTGLGVFFYSMVRLIANMAIKKPIVKASNNAVEICRKTEDMRLQSEERLNQTLSETEERMLKTCAAMENTQKRMEAENKATMDVIKGDRRAVLLMSCVVGRLMEESSLPARTRDEIHTMMTEANRLVAEQKEAEENENCD